jgi:type VI secretion system protein ImpH
VTAAVSLIGLGTPGLSGRCRADEAEETSSDEPAGLEDIALLRYAELLSHVNRPAVGLEGLLADYFEIPVTVVPCVGRWMPLDDDNQTRLGRTGWNDRLGEGTLVGRRVWDAASAIRIVLGPLDGASFQSWLPDRPRIHVLAKLTQLYLRGELRFIVQLVLKARDIPALQLARDGPRARLGWNTWLWTRPRTHDADDVLFRRIRPKL